jgi:hypothetical protein
MQNHQVKFQKISQETVVLPHGNNDFKVVWQVANLPYDIRNTHLRSSPLIQLSRLRQSRCGILPHQAKAAAAPTTTEAARCRFYINRSCRVIRGLPPTTTEAERCRFYFGVSA